MITTIPNKFTNNLLRHQSVAYMATNPTQGKLASLKGLIYTHALDIRAFTSCPVPPHLENLLLSQDKTGSVDISRALFRMHRAVGGSWTEYLKTDEELFRLAGSHPSRVELLSVRTCPFCCTTHGTPRHYVMECPETAPYAVEICDAIENELASSGCIQDFVDAAKKHFLDTNSTPPDPP